MFKFNQIKSDDFLINTNTLPLFPCGDNKLFPPHKSHTIHFTSGLSLPIEEENNPTTSYGQEIVVKSHVSQINGIYE